jgi:hypothetical protein
MEQSKHSINEALRSKFLHLFVPAFIGAVALGISIYADFSYSTQTYTQRIGNVIIIIGAYISYRDVIKERFEVIDGELIMYYDNIYKIVSLLYIIVGTALSGYGDIFISKLQIH